MRFCIALLLIATVAARPTQAQVDRTPGSFPAKNEHVFVPTTFIPDAFVDTELAMGIGYSNSIATDIPIFGPGGQQVATVKGDQLFMNGSLDFSCALRDWIGFYARFSAVARSGTNTATIFASGLSTVSGFGLGWEFRLAETDKSMLSADFSIDRTTVTLIDVASYIANTNLGLARSFTPLLANASARYAYGVNDLIGFSTLGTIGRGENPADDYASGWFWLIGGVASINLTQRYDVPLGFALGLRTGSYPQSFDSVDGNTWAGAASVAYMGRSDFALTLDVDYERVPITYADVKVGYVGLTFGLSYCF